MLDFLSDDVRRNPWPLYAAARTASPVFHEARSGLWLLLDHEGVKRALTDHDAFSSVAVPPTGKAPDWLIFNDPPRHTHRRAVILRAFTPRTVAALEPRVRELSRRLLDGVAGRGEMDLMADYADPLPALVIAELVGIAEADRPRFLGWSDAILGLSYSMYGGPEAQARIAAHAVAREEMRGYLDVVLAERRRVPTDDLLTRLVQAEVDGERLTDDDILGFFQLLVLAGTETTTNTIGNAILCLLEHPAELARLRAQPALLPTAIEEVIRYRSPAQFAYRETRRDVEIAGQTIPAGKLVLAVVGSANRDPKVFAEPDRFDVARDPNPHIAFGHGIHFCLGAPLARLEARVALGDLLERLPDLRLADGEPWPPRKGLLVHGPSRLPLRWRT
jgi:cytochrome P450